MLGDLPVRCASSDEIEDLEPVLADLSVATSDDTATWFDLRTALGG